VPSDVLPSTTCRRQLSVCIGTVGDGDALPQAPTDLAETLANPPDALSPGIVQGIIGRISAKCQSCARARIVRAAHSVIPTTPLFVRLG
jgi:hypothetical protein